MAGVAKAKLSGSTDGRQIKVAATASPGTLIHTAVSGTVPGTFDEIWLYAHNNDSVVRSIVVQLGGTTAPDDAINVDLPPVAGRFLILDGAILQNGAIVRVYATVANVVLISGFVNAITA